MLRNDITGQIIAYEQGELSGSDTISLFAQLVASGLAWQLQGSYGRTAASLIDQGYISRDGRVLQCVGCGE